MSRLVDERTAILAALEAGGIRAATGGKLAPPCVLVEPGDPWSVPERAAPGGRVGRWRLTAIALAADRLAAYDELASAIEAIDAALKPLLGTQRPTWARPLETDAAGTRAAFAAIATMQYASS